MPKCDTFTIISLNLFWIECKLENGIVNTNSLGSIE